MHTHAHTHTHMHALTHTQTQIENETIASVYTELVLLYLVYEILERASLDKRLNDDDTLFILNVVYLSQWVEEGVLINQ